MSERVFLLAMHNHQPVGNFESVFELAFRECYGPLLRTLKDHPRFKFTVHFSGPLWEYMERRERECWDLVGQMTGRGQAELLSSGFYEPILPVIPEDDRLDQVGLMNRFLEKSFGRKPRGLWLAERVWEPNLPRTLAKAGIEYTLLDEEHFHYAGVEDIHGSYLTEDEGAAVRVFPIDKTLRYLIPFHPVEEVKDYLGRVYAGGGLAILGDDGEKFGLWPGTNKLVYGEGWLSRFLDMLDAQGITPLTFSEGLDAFPPVGRVYLPPASYEEMMEWVLEPEDQAVFKRLKEQNPGPGRRFLRGGFFRDFFRKYPESNNLHKRMLLASGRARLQRNEDVRRLVFRAQGNDPYWHGVFGGLYLPHLRQAAYRHIIQAEKRMAFGQGWTRADYDDDGREELIWRGARHSLFVKPSYGGALVSLDSLRLERNLLDVLSRRREAYHQETAEAGPEGKSIHELARRLPEGTEGLLRPDAHLRYSLLDHFFAPDARPRQGQGTGPRAHPDRGGEPEGKAHPRSSPQAARAGGRRARDRLGAREPFSGRHPGRALRLGMELQRFPRRVRSERHGGQALRRPRPARVRRGRSDLAPASRNPVPVREGVRRHPSGNELPPGLEGEPLTGRARLFPPEDRRGTRPAMI